MSKKTAKSKQTSLGDIIEFTGTAPTLPLPQSDLPILTSVGISKENGLYVVYILKTQGDKVISVEKEEPNTKAIAVSVAKINFVKKIQDVEY